MPVPFVCLSPLGEGILATSACRLKPASSCPSGSSREQRGCRGAEAEIPRSVPAAAPGGLSQKGCWGLQPLPACMSPGAAARRRLSTLQPPSQLPPGVEVQALTLEDCILAGPLLSAPASFPSPPRPAPSLPGQDTRPPPPPGLQLLGQPRLGTPGRSPLSLSPALAENPPPLLPRPPRRVLPALCPLCLCHLICPSIYQF